MNTGYFNTTGSQNTFIGKDAGAQTTIGSANTAVGFQALGSSNRTSDDNDANTAVGYQAGTSKTTGNNNVFIGKSSGTSFTSGSSSIYIGQGTGASSGGVSNEIVVGTQIQGKGSDTGYGKGTWYQGNNSSSWSTVSDRRLKKNIVDNTEGLEKINALQVKNFEYRLSEEVTELDQSNAINKAGVQLGVIAQELQEVCPDCVKEESTGVLSVNTDNLTWHMINAIKQLSAKCDSLQAEIDILKGN